MSIWQQPIGNTQLKKSTNRTSSSISNRIPPQPPRARHAKLNYFCELTRTDRHDFIESNPLLGDVSWPKQELKYFLYWQALLNLNSAEQSSLGFWPHTNHTPTHHHLNFHQLFLSSLWSDLIMRGYFFILLSLRNLNLRYVTFTWQWALRHN